jgi:hypothetical protein
MRMLRVRFTVRRMMITVAALAVMLGITRELSGFARERQDRFRKLARDCAAQAQALALSTRIPVSFSAPRLIGDSSESMRFERRYWWLRDMSAIYEQAAGQPLLPVPPEPPEPK